MLSLFNLLSLQPFLLFLDSLQLYLPLSNLVDFLVLDLLGFLLKSSLNDLLSLLKLVADLCLFLVLALLLPLLVILLAFRFQRVVDGYVMGLLQQLRVILHRKKQLAHILLFATVVFNNAARNLLLKVGSEVLLDQLVLTLSKAPKFDIGVSFVLDDDIGLHVTRLPSFRRLGRALLTRFLISAIQYATFLDAHFVFDIDQLSHRILSQLLEMPDLIVVLSNINLRKLKRLLVLVLELG